MKVLHVCTDFPYMKDGEAKSYGGLGLCVLQLIQGLRDSGVDVDVLTRGGEDIDCELVYNVVRSPYIRLTGSRDWKLTHSATLVPWLISMLIRERYDIIHVHNPPAGILAIPVAKIFGIKTMMTMHGPWSFVRDRFKKLAEVIEKLCLYSVDAVTFDSYSLKGMFGKDDKYVAIQNAVDVNKFKPIDKSKCRDELGLCNDIKIFLYSGRAVYGKNLDTIYAVAKKHTGAEFILTGFNYDGRDGFCPNVIFKKSISNSRMSVLYNACDGVILPTKAEGMSRALLEAMACGTAAIASDIPANKEVMGGAGLLFKTDDELVNLIGEYDRKSLMEIGTAGRKFVERAFPVERRIDKFIKLYDQIYTEKK